MDKNFCVNDVVRIDVDKLVREFVMPKRFPPPWLGAEKQSRHRDKPHRVTEANSRFVCFAPVDDDDEWFSVRLTTARAIATPWEPALDAARKVSP